jgi:hypothetical protein
LHRQPRMVECISPLQGWLVVDSLAFALTPSVEKSWRSDPFVRWSYCWSSVSSLDMSSSDTEWKVNCGF